MMRLEQQALSSCVIDLAEALPYNTLNESLHKRRRPVVSKQTENEVLMQQFEKREAGVAELFEFYARVEAVYVTASQALAEGYSATTSNAANPE